MFSGFEILYIIICLIFISLVLFQNNASNGLSNLTGGNSGSSKTKRITMVTKITAGIGLLLFVLTFYIAYDHKEQNNNSSFEVIEIEKKEDKNDN
jgi:protein translocase SecG subunit